jgi:hypothetical protein
MKSKGKVQKLILTFAFCILTFAIPFNALRAFGFEFYQEFGAQTIGANRLV